jgi:hypothetical protein
MGRLNSRNEWLTVVGVAATTRYRELATPRPTLYVPAEQFMITAGRLAIRTSMEPSRVADAVRESIHAVDPTVRVSRVAPYADFMRLPLAWPRFNALLLGVFVAAALLLSAIGLYAVIAASVSQRRSEIGVRVALGATASDVRRLVLGEGLRLSAAGVLVGLSVSFVAMRTLRGLLFEVQPLDPATLFGAAVVLLMAALHRLLRPRPPGDARGCGEDAAGGLSCQTAAQLRAPPSISASRVERSMGLVQWLSKPARVAANTSDGCPYPVRAISRM